MRFRILTLLGTLTKLFPTMEQRRRFAAYGVPEWVNAALESLYLDYRASADTGYAACVTDDVVRIAGRPARTLASLLRENAAAFA